MHRFPLPARRGHDGAVVHLHVGRLARADADRELGSQVKHVGRRRPHHEAFHSIGHSHHEVAVMQRRLQFAAEIEVARPLEDDNDAIAERQFNRTPGERDPASLDGLTKREILTPFARLHKPRPSHGRKCATARRRLTPACRVCDQHPGGKGRSRRRSDHHQDRRSTMHRRPPTSVVLHRPGPRRQAGGQEHGVVPVQAGM